MTDGEMPHDNRNAGSILKGETTRRGSPEAREAEFRQAHPEAARLIDEHNQLDMKLFKWVQDTFEQRWRDNE